jgi:hypothetical protein
MGGVDVYTLLNDYQRGLDGFVFENLDQLDYIMKRLNKYQRDDYYVVSGLDIYSIVWSPRKKKYVLSARG